MIGGQSKGEILMRKKLEKGRSWDTKWLQRNALGTCYGVIVSITDIETKIRAIFSPAKNIIFIALGIAGMILGSMKGDIPFNLMQIVALLITMLLFGIAFFLLFNATAEELAVYKKKSALIFWFGILMNPKVFFYLLWAKNLWPYFREEGTVVILLLAIFSINVGMRWLFKRFPAVYVKLCILNSQRYFV